jgi:predicted DNA-binding antitoxin AbrB/MazE fold protein
MRVRLSRSLYTAARKLAQSGSIRVDAREGEAIGVQFRVDSDIVETVAEAQKALSKINNKDVLMKVMQSEMVRRKLIPASDLQS